MTTTSKTITTLAALAALAGCGASVPDRAQIPQHRWTDGDWYADALDEAVGAYEAEVELAASRRYDDALEAAAVARTHGEARFDAHLTRALHERGLTRRGLGVYGRVHPEFVDAQRARIAPRMTSARRSAATIVDRVDAEARPIVAFDHPGEPDTRVAKRD